MPSRDCNHHHQPATGVPATRWYPSLASAGLIDPQVHGAARHWLTVEGSFTRALQRVCRERFHVDVRHEGFGRPTLEEARHLGLPERQLAWVREVALCGDGSPWVLARTLVPLACLNGRGRRLRQLGRKPLGAYLFSSPDWQRGPLETGLCQPRHSGDAILARRSVFHNGRHGLLVGEYLLPSLLTNRHTG